MKRTPVLVFICLLSVGAFAQKVLTGKEIYRLSCKAIVQVYVNSIFSGVGFIVSPDGTIITANHVITTRDSRFREYAKDIRVVVFNNGAPQVYMAAPVPADVSPDQTNFDTAILKIVASGLPYLNLGSWDEVEVGDTVTVTPSFPNIGCIMLQGIVSAKSAFSTDLGPRPVNTLFFQAPIRNGFSGSPIFDAKGHVIGIEDTKVFGISPALDALRTQWQSGQSVGTIRITGIDVAASFTEIINNLDQNLISGLGSGVDITYAKERQHENKNKQNR